MLLFTQIKFGYDRVIVSMLHVESNYVKQLAGAFRFWNAELPIIIFITCGTMMTNRRFRNALSRRKFQENIGLIA